MEPVHGGGKARRALRRLLVLGTIDTGPLRRHRDLRLLYVGQGVSGLGSAIRMVAVPYQIYRLTHSSLAVGLLGPIEVIPILLLAFVGGALADAHDRRRLVQLTEAALAVLAAV